MAAGGEQQVISNINKINKFKIEKKSKFPRLCTNLTLINSNIGELVDFVDIAEKRGWIFPFFQKSGKVQLQREADMRVL